VLKRAAQQRFVAWLAFAAMALIVLMPAISRSMCVDTGMGDMSGMSMAGMGADCPMNQGHVDHQRPAVPGDPTARCGYCVLLAHSPVAGLTGAWLWMPVELGASAPHIFVAHRAPIALLLSAHPRGPPLYVNG
jgi:hypothetical protein